MSSFLFAQSAFMCIHSFYSQTSEHKEKINDVCYNGSKDTIYSGSNDKYIIEWLYPSMEFKR